MMMKAKFGTAINCMDGRVQEPVIRWVQAECRVQHVDKITEAGPIKYLAEGSGEVCDSIRERLRVSIEQHGSRVIAITGHHDCAGNPAKRKEQEQQLKLSCELVQSWFPQVKIYGLYVNETWQVEVIGTVED